MSGHPRPRGPGLSASSISTEPSSGSEREILVQHLLVNEDNAKLLQRVSTEKKLYLQNEEFQVRMQDPEFMEQAQFIDV